MGSINRDDVRHVARLARLALPEEQIATITGQLEPILDYVSHLQSIDTTGVPPTTRAVEVVNVTRADQVIPATLREGLLNQAPQREGDLLVVPRLLADQEAG
ncbi:MAG: Asp-tRNA(Asn)/Glu-tRNA(Gln) amidotransferase subunit GatC [Cyanobacteria bacterium MAG CAR3_bin_5]|nr:Asp-tRNA(Asn)/Glu-tRNA(Gln) amidotransferase subunit GatC [Cyanobacteria bacterium MAG CAR3_bin_5]